MTNKNGTVVPAPQELETFLPVDSVNGVTKYKIQPAKKDPENGAAEFNPFLERKNQHATSDNETLTHLLKASLGTGILSMPLAFRRSGLVFGIFGTILTAFVCTHCSYILVKCAHVLYKKTRRTTMNFAEVAESAFMHGPKWGRKFAKCIKVLILQSLFWTYFGTCSVYTVIIASNIKQVCSHYFGEVMGIQGYIALLLIPLVLLSWVPNLKYLAPFSTVANLFMGISLGITFYYTAIGLPSLESRPMVNPKYAEWPEMVSITIFAMEAIGVMMPLENQMKTPQNLVGICGVLNKGMSGVTFLYILLGFMGYLRYGDATEANITLNLPVGDILAQSVQIFVALAVFCTFGLQFFVCLEIGWDSIKDKFTKRPTLVNYVMRTVLVTAAVLLAVAVPQISPFIGLIGAFCFSILGLLVPVAIEIVTYWDKGFGPGYYLIWKNIILCIFGVCALIFGSRLAINDIIQFYAQNATAAAAAVNGTHS